MGSDYKHSWDRNFCFNIDDFKVGDSLLVRAKGSRIKGRVESVNKKEMLVLYRTAENELRSARLNDIILLDVYRKDWFRK